MNLDHILDQNVILQFNRPIYIVGYMPQQNAFVPVPNPADPTKPTLSEMVAGMLSKSASGEYSVTYANPLDGGRTLIQATFDSSLVLAACVTLPMSAAEAQPASDMAASPSAS